MYIYIELIIILLKHPNVLTGGCLESYSEEPLVHLDFAFIPKYSPHVSQSCRLRAAGHGGETLSEVLFLPDLWEGPGISSVFSRAGLRGCLLGIRLRRESTSVWENCRCVVQTLVNVYFEC